jgi:hypothetical protein
VPLVYLGLRARDGADRVVVGNLRAAVWPLGGTDPPARAVRASGSGVCSGDQVMPSLRIRGVYMAANRPASHDPGAERGGRV